MGLPPKVRCGSCAEKRVVDLRAERSTTVRTLGSQSRRGGQFDRELGPAARLALRADRAAVGLDDLPRGRQSQARTTAFRREKSIEDLRPGILIHSTARILEAEKNIPPRFKVRMFFRETVIDFHLA